MRVLILHDYAGHGGGAELLARQLRAGARAAGHEAWLMTSTAGAEPGDPDPPDRLTVGTIGRARGLLQTANPLAARDVRRAVAHLRPDVVQVLGYLTQLSPLVLPACRDIPCAYYALWYRAVCPTGTKLLPTGAPCTVQMGTACLARGCLPAQDWPVLMLQHRLMRRWSGVFDHVSAASESVRRELEAGGVSVHEVVAHGVSEAPAGTPSPSPLVTFAGRLVASKGADVALEAFARVASMFPDARMALVGAGPQAPQLRARVAALGLDGRVELPGRITPHELDGLLSSSWVHLVPSRWAEPFGLVAAQASMRAVAVIASASGGLVDIVDHGQTGWLVPVDDVAAMAGALEALLRDPGRRIAMGVAGRRRMLERYTSEHFMRRMISSWERLV